MAEGNLTFYQRRILGVSSGEDDPEPVVRRIETKLIAGSFATLEEAAQALRLYILPPEGNA